MKYLQPEEYVQHGLTAETTDDWIVTASALIDAHCRRPSLAVYEYTERIRITAGSEAVRLSYRPLAAEAGNQSPLVSIRVRYGRPRRGESLEPFREQVAAAFGIPGSWSTLDISALDVNTSAGEVGLPQNFLGLNYNEAEITYTAGFVTIPVSIKVACAQIVKNAQATPSLNVKSSRMDSLQMEYFSGSLIDPEVRSLLRPYLAERLG
jgi:hypothetical protein